jgi:NifU-like protein involved in Fe-S cluster formation
MYSQQIMALFHGARHAGTAEGETHRGAGGEPGRGPHIALSLRVEAGVVRDARYQTYGCPVAIACSEAACLWSKGRPLEALRAVTAAAVTDWLGGVPEGKEHVPPLAARALNRAAEA